MCALSSADRVPGYEPVGQRFESSRARHKNEEDCNAVFFVFIVRSLHSSLSQMLAFALLHEKAKFDKLIENINFSLAY